MATKEQPTGLWIAVLFCSSFGTLTRAGATPNDAYERMIVALRQLPDQGAASTDTVADIIDQLDEEPPANYVRNVLCGPGDDIEFGIYADPEFPSKLEVSTAVISTAAGTEVLNGRSVAEVKQLITQWAEDESARYRIELPEEWSELDVDDKIDAYFDGCSDADLVTIQ